MGCENKAGKTRRETNIKKRAIALASTICLLLGMSGCKSGDYRKANELLNQQQYEDALDVYVKLGDYEDSHQKILECKYEIALQKIEEQDLNGAIEILDGIGEYKDAVQQATECKYELAMQHYENQEFKEALDMLQTIEGYKDAQKTALECEKEIGMREKADYDFLNTISESIMSRLETSRTGQVANSTLVATELAYLEQYESMDFYDADLGALAHKYIKGLYTQRDAASQPLKSEEQLKWQEGVVERFDVLKELYEKYGLLKDNKDFIGTYVADVENQHKVLDGIYAIDEDLGQQLSVENQSSVVKKTNYWNVSYCLQNNTEYTFDLNFVFKPVDKDGAVFDSNIYYVADIKPGAKYTVTCYVSQPAKVDTISLETYYSNIK